MLYVLSIFLVLVCQSETLNIQGLTIDKHDNSVLLDGPNVKNTPSSIDVTEIGDLISRSFWAGRMKDDSSVDLTNHDFPKANLLVVNYGLDSKDAKDLGDATEMTYDFFPADSVSLTTSMSTSETPNKHGVVGTVWYTNDSPVEAYSNPHAYSSSITFPQLVGNQHKTTKVVAGSAEPKLAKSFVQNHFPVDSLNGETFESHHDLGFTKSELKETMKTDEFWINHKEHVQELEESHPLTTPFLMEVEYIRRLTKNMKAEEYPVLYNIATKTPEFPEAKDILKDALRQLKASFQETHPDGNSQLVFMKEPTIVHKADVPPVLPHYHPIEFSAIANITNVTTDYYVYSDSRSYQISFWLFWFALFFLCMTTNSMVFMDYNKDSRLFTTWQVGKGDKKGMGMGGSGPDMRSFNIRS